MGVYVGTHLNAPQRTNPQRSATPWPSRVPQSKVPSTHCLQRAVGNRAITRFLGSAIIQPKLTVSHPDDPYEREADRVADQVMRMPDPQAGLAVQRSTLKIPRVCTRCEDDELQRQPNRAVGATLKEEDNHDGLRRPVATQSFGSSEPSVQLKGVGEQSPEMSPAVAADIHALKGNGDPLPEATRSFFEPRFGADFSQVRVHTNDRAVQSASALKARAFTANRHIVFGAGEYRPETQSGLRLLSHELVHVLQQSASGALSGQAADHLGEHHADRIAPLYDRSERRLSGTRDSVTQDTSPSPAGSIQRFGESEHREIGDDATRSAAGAAKIVQLAAGYRLTYGEMVAMAADHFESIDQMRAFARKPGPGSGTREEIEYVRVVVVHGLKAREKDFSKDARQAADKRYYALAARNPSHFVNPESGDIGKSTAEKALAHHTVNIVGKLTEVPNNAVGYYRRIHIRAIVEAWKAGKAGQPIDQAMAAEAYSNHYLTDSFSAGHNRTARTSAPEYWNKKVPLFFYNFKGFMAERLAYWINEHNWRGYPATVDYIWLKAKNALESTLGEKGMPDFTFGDLVSGAIHDYDNTKGIKASVDGQDKMIFGDSNLHKGDTKDVAVKAVQASVIDVETAYQAGIAKADLIPVTEKMVTDGLFRAERMIPVATPDSALAEPARAIKWDYPTAFELLSDRKFREGLIIFMAAKKSELAGVGNGLKEKFQRDAFKAAIVDHMAGDEGITMIWRIIGWTPNTGGGAGGHNQDDNALDYYNHAKTRGGGLASLLWSARANLILNLVDGPTGETEENAILDLLVTCPSDSDAHLVINYVTWNRLKAEVGKRFEQRYPKEKYKSK